MDVLTSLSIFLAFGLAFDKVLFGPSERIALNNYLNAERKATWNERFIAFVVQANKVVFSRFFSGNALSRRFLTASLTVSTLSFLVAVTFQVMINDQFTETLKFSYEQVWLVFALFAFNTALDYTSIVQTKIFLDFAIASNSALKSLLLLFCDAIVKMNVFILAFSAVLLSIVYVYTRNPENATIIFPSRSLDESGGRSPIDGDILQKYGLNSDVARTMELNTIPIILAADGSESRIALVFFYSTPSMDYTDFFESYIKSFGSIVVDTEPANIDDADIKNIIDVYNKSGREQFLNPSVRRAHIRLRFHGIKDLDWGYTGVFVNVDQIENGFPATLFGQNAFLALEKAIFDSTLAMSRGGDWYYCTVEGVGRSGRISVGGVPQNCDSLAIITDVGESIFSSLTRLPSQLALVGRNVEDLWIPYTTLFITSLLPTSMFLVGSLLLAILVIIFNFMDRVSVRLSRYIERAPFTLASLLLGAVLITLGAV